MILTICYHQVGVTPLTLGRFSQFSHEDEVLSPLKHGWKIILS